MISGALPFLIEVPHRMRKDEAEPALDETLRSAAFGASGAGRIVKQVIFPSNALEILVCCASTGIPIAQSAASKINFIKQRFLLGCAAHPNCTKRCKNFLISFKALAFLRKISSSLSDAELLNRYRANRDLNVLGELYQRYMDLVYGVCLKYFKEPDDAQDAVMAVFEELAAKLHLHEVSNFKSWLHTVAKNHCLMKLRSGKRSITTSLSDDFVQSGDAGHLEEDVWIREENLQQLEHCLEQLGADQKRVIKAFYLQQQCYQQIVADTGWDWSRVRSYIQNGRRNLRICMENRKAKQVV